MPIETATYISDLNTANPTHTDGFNVQDQHTRLIKAVAKNTFPNLTGAVTATQADLNATTGLVSAVSGTVTVPIPTGSSTTGGTLILKGAGTNPDISLVNSGASGLLIKSGTTTVATIDASGNVTATGNLNAVLLKQAANVLLPSGVIIQWHGSVATIPAGWVLCDGTNATPDLRDKFVIGASTSGTYNAAATGGAASASPTSSSAGAHTHGGATGAGGGHTHTASSDSQGSHTHSGATDSHTLTVAELPAHAHTFTAYATTQGTGSSPGGWNQAVNPISETTDAAGSNAGHAHTISADGAHIHNVTLASVADHAHSISSDGSHTHSLTVATLPPFFALCFIMKT